MPDQALGFRVQNYGMVKHKNLFTRRQLTALTSFSDLTKEVRLRFSLTRRGRRLFRRYNNLPRICRG